jgi:hypothetical protein
MYTSWLNRHDIKPAAMGWKPTPKHEWCRVILSLTVVSFWHKFRWYTIHLYVCHADRKRTEIKNTNEIQLHFCIYRIQFICIYIPPWLLEHTYSNNIKNQIILKFNNPRLMFGCLVLHRLVEHVVTKQTKSFFTSFLTTKPNLSDKNLPSNN